QAATTSTASSASPRRPGTPARAARRTSPSRTPRPRSEARLAKTREERSTTVRKLGQICSMVLAVALFSFCLALLSIRTLGLGTFVVTGSSMEPAIHKGSLVIIEPVAPALIQRGDVITFEHYGQMTTHRVIAIDSSNASGPVFTTKGDANAVADPEPVRFTGQVGLYRSAIPLLGYAIVYAQ